MTGPFLRSTRKLLGFTLKRLSKKTGISFPRIQHYETSLSGPPEHHVPFLKQVLRENCLKNAEELKRRAKELK